MTKEMQMMANEFIKRDLSIKEIIEIMWPLSRVLQDRNDVQQNIYKRFSAVDVNEIEHFAKMIEICQEEEKKDYEESEAVLRKYELDYDVDELLGTELW